ncbi:hypothetical protein RKD26_002069 [Streptomyces calvus]
MWESQLLVEIGCSCPLSAVIRQLLLQSSASGSWQRFSELLDDPFVSLFQHTDDTRGIISFHLQFRLFLYAGEFVLEQQERQGTFRHSD